MKKKYYLAALLVMLSFAVIAQSLELSKSVNIPNPLTGNTFEYTLQYRCASIVNDCNNVFVTDVLPAGIEYVGVVGSTHTTSETYNSSTRTVTFTFVNPLNAGSTGTLKILARFPNGITPNGMVTTNQANMTASNAPPVTSNPVTVTSVAVDRVEIIKYVTILGNTSTAMGSAATNEPVDYTISVCNPSSTTIPGTLNATNAVISDVLPTGAIFVDATGGGVYNSATNTVTWPATTIAVGTCVYKHLVVRYPNPPYSLGDVIVNNAQVNYTPVGEAPKTDTDGANVQIMAPENRVRTNKTLPFGTSYSPGFVSYYEINVANRGNTTLYGYSLVDVIPSGITVQDIGLGGWYFPTINDDSTPVMQVEYKTNLNSTYRITSSSPYTVADLYSNTTVPITDFNLVAGEYITEIKWVLLTPFLPPTFTYDPMTVGFRVNDDTPTSTITNCLTSYATSTYGSGGPGTGPGGQGSTTSSTPFLVSGTPCVDLSVTGLLTTAMPRPSKWIDNGPGPFGIGDTITFKVYAGNAVGGQEAIHPILYDLLPEGLEYVAGSMINLEDNIFPSADIVTVTPNYNGTNRTLLKWEWTNDTLIQGRNSDTYSFDVVIQNEAGFSMVTNTLLETAQNGNDCTWGPVDTYDVDNDGNTTEHFCYFNATPDIAATAALESRKEVKGQLDEVYSRYPDVGQTVPGGIADYRLKIWNPGNVPMTDIIVIDILPYIGDMGVIDPTPRQTEWEPYLAGPVTPPSGVTVYYSTASNPCRSAEGIMPSGPVGCTAPNWSTTPPADITTVQSLRFDFGSIVLNPDDSLFLTWPMRAPVNAPSNGEIAWNSFAYIATQTNDNSTILPSEPIKVGIELLPLDPAIFGNYVWVDTNQNGLQDEVGTGIAGVRVELYMDNGDGISDPNTDIFMGFTVTDAAGNYLFPNLTQGNYFAQFFPPTGYAVSPSNIGTNDALDSDGIITPVTTLDPLEDDRTWDLGVYLSNACDVAIKSYTSSLCSYDGTNSTYTLSVFLEWANPPTGQDITVSIDGASTQTINVTGGTTSPTMLTFTLPADGASHEITALFNGGSSCADTMSYWAPLPCNTCNAAVIDVNVGVCQPDGNAILGVLVAWSSPPSGEHIIVTTGSQSQTIDVANSTSPSMLIFTVASDGATHNVTATFDNTTNCSSSETYTLENCNPCSIKYANLTVSICNNNNTPTNPNDDTYTFTLNPSGSDTGTNYQVLNGATVLGTGTYGTPLTLGPYNISAGALSITIRDVDDTSCVLNLTVNPPFSCSNCPAGNCLGARVVPKTN